MENSTTQTYIIPIVYFLLTGIFSIYLSLKAHDIFIFPFKKIIEPNLSNASQTDDTKSLKEILGKINSNQKDNLNSHFRIHNFYFHLICYLLGWISTYILIIEVTTFNKISEFDLNHALFSAFCLLSITGYLPPFIDGLSKTPRSIAEKLSK